MLKGSLKNISLKFVTIIISATLIFLGIPKIEYKKFSAKTTIGEIDAIINSLKDDLKDATSDRKDAEQSYNEAKEKYESFKENKIAIDNEIDAIYQEAEVLKSLVAAYSEMTVILDERIAENEIKLEKQLAVLRERLRTNFEDGGSNYISLLFGSDKLFDFLASAETLSIIIEKDTELIKECENMAAELNKQKEELKNIKISAEDKSSELMSTLISLEERQDELGKILEDLEADTDKALTAYLEAKKEEDAFLEKLEEQLAEKEELENSTYPGGDFAWPLPSKYKRISSKFGNRIHPVLGTPQFHKGIDIPAPLNTEIYSVNRGTVTETGNNYANGKYVIVDHGGGITTMYAHLNTIKVKKGDILAKGEVLGLVGRTGYATGYHLHMSVYVNGKAVDPEDYY